MLSVANRASPWESPIPAITTGGIPLANPKLHPMLLQQKTSMKVTPFPTLQPHHEEQSLLAQKKLCSDPERKIS